MAERGSGDELWDSFVAEYEKGNAIREPSAAERVPAAVPPHPRQGRGPGRLSTVLVALAAVAATAAGLFFVKPLLGSPSAGAGAAVPSGLPSTGAGGSAAPATPRPVIPLDQAFPRTVPGPSGLVYTRVGDVTLNSCTEADSVAPTLAGLITQSQGCLGLEYALYRDGAKDQFDLALFTMRQPQDAVALTTDLAANPTDHEVGAQAPPPGSGLPTLPADSGMVQQFAATGRVLTVALGQWADGRVADYQKLEERTTPLMNAVTGRVLRYERG